MPALAKDVVSAATPDTFSVPVPIDTPLSRKVTVPVAAAGVTVAVKVMFCFACAGFRLEASAVALDSLLTVMVTEVVVVAAPVLAVAVAVPE